MFSSRFRAAQFRLQLFAAQLSCQPTELDVCRQRYELRDDEGFRTFVTLGRPWLYSKTSFDVFDTLSLCLELEARTHIHALRR